MNEEAWHNEPSGPLRGDVEVRGSKNAVSKHMVAAMLGLPGKLQADAADALAIAVTHAHVRATAQRLGINAKLAWRR